MNFFSIFWGIFGIFWAENGFGNLIGRLERQCPPTSWLPKPIESELPLGDVIVDWFPQKAIRLLNPIHYYFNATFFFLLCGIGLCNVVSAALIEVAEPDRLGREQQRLYLKAGHCRHGNETFLNEEINVKEN